MFRRDVRVRGLQAVRSGPPDRRGGTVGRRCPFLAAGQAGRFPGLAAARRRAGGHRRGRRDAGERRGDRGGGRLPLWPVRSVACHAARQMRAGRLPGDPAAPGTAAEDQGQRPERLPGLRGARRGHDPAVRERQRGGGGRAGHHAVSGAATRRGVRGPARRRPKAADLQRQPAGRRVLRPLPGVQLRRHPAAWADPRRSAPGDPQG